MEYGIKLEIFEGPMDLLLHLIQKDNLDIYDIPISKITSEYILYLDIIKQLNLDSVGDFLIMASTLMRIKSKMLLPTHDDEEEDEFNDPRDELVKRLLEYKKYKEAANKLRNNLENQKDSFYRKVTPEFIDEDFGVEVTLFDLIDAFKSVLAKAKKSSKEIIKDEYTIEQKIRVILSLLEGKSFVSFYSLFAKDETRVSIIVTFLAMLELIKIGQLYVRQNNHFSEIRVYRKVNEQSDSQKL
ncbi:MAG: segregation/condensation protein A [Elusimicrobia bacterium]|nr:segregation/condensation protein A [Elusimicrobiota bacterium]